MNNQDNSNSYSNEGEALKVLSSVLNLLSPLPASDRERILQTIGTFFNMSLFSQATSLMSKQTSDSLLSQNRFVGLDVQNKNVTAKAFLMEKQPKTDVERVACLAYYLTHYRETPHFKTIDITNINTEAAQPKFSNAAKATSNAAEYGYLAPANKGNRQLSAAGELFVQALPDREAARAAMASARPKKNNSGKKKRSSEQDEAGSDE